MTLTGPVGLIQVAFVSLLLVARPLPSLASKVDTWIYPGERKGKGLGARWGGLAWTWPLSFLLTFRGYQPARGLTGWQGPLGNGARLEMSWEQLADPRHRRFSQVDPTPKRDENICTEDLSQNVHDGLNPESPALEDPSPAPRSFCMGRKGQAGLSPAPRRTRHCWARRLGRTSGQRSERKKAEAGKDICMMHRGKIWNRRNH